MTLRKANILSSNLIHNRTWREGFAWHYRGLMRLDIFPLFAVWVAWRRKNPAVPSVATSILSLLPVISAACVIIAAFRLLWKPRLAIRDTVLWIESPSSKTVRALPFYTALRVVRKHNWTLVPVEPVRPVRKVSRWEAVKIVVRGDV